MEEKALIKKEIIQAPEYYFNAQSKTLEERLKQIDLSEQEKMEIIEKKSKKLIRDKVLGLFKIGEIVNAILNWNEDIDKDIREAKKEYLMASYFEKQEDNEIALSKLKEFLTSAQGNTLFNKILRILDDSPPDLELANHLVNALKYIVSSEFEKLFEAHKYGLAQIEKLSPQALTILSDYKNWPQFRLNSLSATGSKITSEWLSEFANTYSLSKNIQNKEYIERIAHSINELINSRFMEAHLIKDQIAYCKVTKIGMVLLPYIS